VKAKTILLVEDNHSDVDLTRRALARTGAAHQLVVVEDGQEALDYLFGEGRYSGDGCGELPALGLLDLNLPRVRGLEVLHQIRQCERTRRLLVVVLTTSLEERDLAQSYDLHANSYIRKPVDFNQFSQAIGAIEKYWLDLNELPPPVVLK